MSAGDLEVTPISGLRFTQNFVGDADIGFRFVAILIGHRLCCIAHAVAGERKGIVARQWQFNLRIDVQIRRSRACRICLVNRIVGVDD